MKYSAQRELIKDVLKDNKDHPTADEVFIMVKQEMPNISLATVYRNLNQLAEQGVIAKISMPDGGDRFDSSPHEHCHLICNSCGKIYDLDLPLDVHLDDLILDAIGFRVNKRQFIAQGICTLCQGH